MRRKILTTVLFVFGLSTVASGVSAKVLDPREIESMSSQEKLEAAGEARQSLLKASSRIESLHGSAVAADEDASRVRCLNEALVSVNGFLAVASRSYESLQIALSAGDRRSADHHLLMVSTSADRVSTIEAQAAQCVGGALRYVGDTQVVQHIDSKMAEYDPMAFDEDSGGAFIFLEELPPRASAER